MKKFWVQESSVNTG